MFAEAGATVIVTEGAGGCTLATPLPDSITLMGMRGGLLMSDRLPVIFPTEVGANCRSKLKLWPDGRLKRSGKLDALKPSPIRAARLTVKGPPVVFVSVTT